MQLKQLGLPCFVRPHPPFGIGFAFVCHAAKQRRIRVIGGTVFFDGSFASVRVALHTAVRAGVVYADVHALRTAAHAALVFFGGKIQRTPADAFDARFVDTGGT